jgi:hypothetical protein
LDALDQGFCSVEADIFLVQGKLLVGHTFRELRPERTLESLYLQPLQARVRENGGRVYRDGPSIVLFIDIKSDGAKTYAVLRSQLQQYADMLSQTKNGHFEQRAVTVVVSGNRPIELIKKEAVQFMGVDGRLSDLDSTEPSALMPVISDNWRLHFRWRGDGAMPAAERQKLRGVVAKAHAQGRRVRFWATPEKEAFWKELLAAGVDLVNTDELARLGQFLRNQKDGSPQTPSSATTR